MGDNIVIHFNSPGHPHEYTAHLPGYGPMNYIPTFVEKAFAARLGDGYRVDNRGSRLEVISSRFHEEGAGERHLPAIRDALVQAVAGLYGTTPDVEEAVFADPPAAPEPKSPCNCGCGQELTLRERFEHRRAKRAAEEDATRAALANLDGSDAAAVSAITGYSRGELDDLGGFTR